MKSFNVKIDIITIDMVPVSLSTKMITRESALYYVISKDDFALIPLELKNRLAYFCEFFNAVKDFGFKLEQSEAAMIPYGDGWAVVDVGAVITTAKH